MNFSRQLAAFVRAGIPIIDAIDTLRAEAGNARFREVLAEVAEALRSGTTFADAISAHSDVFPDFYVTILRSAELTGHVGEVLDQLGQYLERDENARRKIKSATTYPAVIIAVAIIAVTVICWFALPRFQEFFDSLDAELPLTTRILLNITDFLTSYWWVLLLGFVALLVGVALSANQPRSPRPRSATTCDCRRRRADELHHRRAVLPHPRIDGEVGRAGPLRDGRHDRRHEQPHLPRGARTAPRRHDPR